MTGDPAIVSTAEAPRPVGPYSQAVEAGDFLFLSGQIGLDLGSGRSVVRRRKTVNRKVRHPGNSLLYRQLGA